MGKVQTAEGAWKIIMFAILNLFRKGEGLEEGRLCPCLSGLDDIVSFDPSNRWAYYIVFEVHTALALCTFLFLAYELSYSCILNPNPLKYNLDLSSNK